ncbi:MAG: hypothetical protein HY553_11315 [Elusimicrobia bacterium]|nr:hypothetical protein [Elusimicrobiota bacterium]
MTMKTIAGIALMALPAMAAAQSAREQLGGAVGRRDAAAIPEIGAVVEAKGASAAAVGSSDPAPDPSWARLVTKVLEQGKISDTSTIYQGFDSWWDRIQDRLLGMPAKLEASPWVMERGFPMEKAISERSKDGRNDRAIVVQGRKRVGADRRAIFRPEAVKLLHFDGGWRDPARRTCTFVAELGTGRLREADCVQTSRGVDGVVSMDVTRADTQRLFEIEKAFWLGKPGRP